jgi:ABC-type transport system involved in multi-copper enzyme maturation permease subunit
MSLVKSGITWLRQAVAMSNSWPSWQERLVLALFLLIAVGLGFLTARIDLWKAALVWGVYFIAMAVCSRQGWLQLFGPVLFYDMVRTARRSRYVIMRLLYSLVLLGILIVMFLDADINPRDRQRDSALMAQTFFSIFMIVQLVMVVLLTPAYVAGAIAEEKDRKTLEFMLATDLNNREIILSKLLSRVGNMTLLLLTGLPILSILQFMGGVDAELMLAGFAATGLTMLGIASVGILLSTLFQKPRDAIGLTYLFIITYLALATTTLVMDKASPPMRSWMNEEILFENGPTWRDASQALNSGNPIAAIVNVQEAMNKASLGADLPGIVQSYAWFHGVLSVVCIGWSIFRLRSVALRQTAGGKTAKLSWWERYRPPVGELPMMWKELNIEGRMKLNWLAWGVIIVLVVLTLGSGLLIVGVFLWDRALGGNLNWHMQLAEPINVWFRIAGTGVGTLMILMVAVRASTCITNERERDTFDALITTPMSGDAMLGAKLLGCITSVRMGWLWFGSMLTVAVLTGGIHLLAVPLVITEWFVYAAFFAMVGMGYSMSCQSSMRATVYTVMTTLMLGGGHWLVMGLCCYFPAATLMRGGNPGSFIEYLAKFQAGMTPPFVMGLSAYSWEDLGHNFSRREFGEWIAFSMVGLFLWAMGGLILWYGVLVPKFRLITRREELIYQ